MHHVVGYGKVSNIDPPSHDVAHDGLFHLFRLKAQALPYALSRIWQPNLVSAVWSTAFGHTELDHIALHEKYGPIVRIAPDEVSFSSPHVAREVLAAGKGYHKTDFYGVFPPPENPDIFTETREAVHAQKKRVASMPYSMKAMQSLTGFVEDTISLLLQKIDTFADSPSKPLDLGDWLHFFAFDVGLLPFPPKGNTREFLPADEQPRF